MLGDNSADTSEVNCYLRITSTTKPTTKRTTTAKPTTTTKPTEPPLSKFICK